jgi:DMSO/TMAO reductase YedYZ molybdopterin-dependent catalytic subunit/thiosulfate reductase cytochrome b subunit
MQEAGLPPIVLIAHLINFFCLLILIRSGIQILYDHPKLYWTDHTTGDNHWLRFGRKIMPKDKLWTSLDEAEDPGKGALPGGTHNLGAGRSWHFTAAIIWVVTGLIYIGFLITSDEWRRIVPTDAGVFHQAWDVMYGYLTLNIPPEAAGSYNALQQLTYFSVIFILAPIMILTGLAMSPALVARFPWYLKLFGDRRQVARSLHFLGMAGFSLFILVHITITMLFHFYDSVKTITFGHTDVNFAYALTLFLAVLVLILAFNIWASFFTLNNQVKLRGILTRFYTPVVRFLFGWMKSNQHYTKEDISPFFRVNGYPPETAEYHRLKSNHFKDWHLKVEGLVEKPLKLSLSDLKAMPKQEQITKHNCIQGWTAIGEWGGVPMRDIIKLCQPSKQAKYVIFHCYDEDDKGAAYYSGLRIKDMLDPQTILAYEMNGKPLPIEHGAPLRLRCERKYGYKMAKYLKSIEFVSSFASIGQGRGGYREDTVFFDWEASI